MLSGVEAALAAAGRGLALFPLPPGARRPVAGWHRQCSSDRDEVQAMVAAGNVGVGCRASDVVVLDLDRGVGDGVASLAAACAAWGQVWPDTFTVGTPGGGLHLYFRAGGRAIGSTSGGRCGLGVGVDSRGPGRCGGGYVVGPGSVVAGQGYELVRDAVVAPLPGWLVEVLHRPAAVGEGASGRGHGSQSLPGLRAPGP